MGCWVCRCVDSVEIKDKEIKDKERNIQLLEINECNNREALLCLKELEYIKMIMYIEYCIIMMEIHSCKIHRYNYINKCSIYKYNCIMLLCCGEVIPMKNAHNYYLCINYCLVYRETVCEVKNIYVSSYKSERENTLCVPILPMLNIKIFNMMKEKLLYFTCKYSMTIFTDDETKINDYNDNTKKIYNKCLQDYMSMKYEEQIYLISLYSIPFTIKDTRCNIEYICDTIYDNIYVKEITNLNIKNIFINSPGMEMFNVPVSNYKEICIIDNNVISETEMNDNFIICDGKELYDKQKKIKMIIEFRKSKKTMEQSNI